ncbi:hypothetical protein FVEN_g12860 [Fusarium venenatum]|nr:hypothetical protein FVEN_g12860 [Fusarium venenatum]
MIVRINAFPGMHPQPTKSKHLILSINTQSARTESQPTRERVALFA